MVIKCCALSPRGRKVKGLTPGQTCVELTCSPCRAQTCMFRLTGDRKLPFGVSERVRRVFQVIDWIMYLKINVSSGLKSR